MRIAAGELGDHESVQTLDLLRDWHEWAAVDIKGHFEDVTEAKLSARATAKAVDFAALRQHHRVHITARCVGQLERLQGLGKSKEKQRSESAMSCKRQNLFQI